MMRKTKLVFLLFILLGVYSCKKTDVKEPFVVNNEPYWSPCGDHINYYEGYLIFDPFYWMPDQRYEKPIFLYNSDDEFFCCYYDVPNGYYAIKKFNIQTQEETIVVTGFNVGSYHRNEDNHIVLFGGYDIHTVASDGTQLKRETYNQSNSSPFWIGNRFYWNYVLGSKGTSYATKTLDSELIDTISYNFLNNGKYSDYRAGKLLIRNLDLQVGYYESMEDGFLNLDNFTPIREIKDQYFDLTWHPNMEKVYLCDENGIYVIYLNGTMVQLIDTECVNYYYSSVSCSGNGKYLISERIRYEVAQVDNYDVHYEIWLIDLETLEEIKLDL